VSILQGREMLKVIRSNLLRYGIAVVAVAVASVLTVMIEPLRDKTVFMMYFAAIMISAYYGGLGPGLLATLLSSLTTAYFFIPPFYSFGAFSWTDLIRFMLFIIVAIMISTLNERRKQAEEEVRRSEEWFSTTLGSIGDAVIATDAEGRVVFLNHVAQSLTGWGQEAKGRALKDVFNILNEETHQAVESPVDKVLRLKSVIGLANHTILIAKDGREVPIDDSGAPIRDSRGEIIGVVLVFRDISQRKHEEQIQDKRTRQTSLRAEVIAALAESGDLERMLQGCCEAMVKHLGAAFARIWTLNREENVLELRASAGIYTHKDGPHSRVSVGQLKIGLIAQERRPHLTNDVLNDPRVSDKDWARQEGMIAFAGYPLIVEDRLVGVMAMFSRETLSEDILDALASVADTVAQGIERKRAEEAFRGSEERFRLLVEGVRDYAIFMLDPKGNVVSWNPGAERVLGYKAEEVIGRHFSLFFIPEERALGKAEEEMSKAATEGRAEDERWHLRKDGTTLWSMGVTTSLRDEQGNLRGFAKIMRDATERKLVEEERVRVLALEKRARTESETAERRSAFLAEASEVLSSSLDYQTTLASLARLAVPYLADWCAVDIVEDDGSIKQLGVAHVDPTKVEMAKELSRRYPPDPNSPRGVPQVLRTGHSEMATEIPDSLLVEAARDSEHLRIARELGLKSYMVVPLIARGRTLGTITFITAESGYGYGEADLEFAEELARRAALAVDNARLYKEAQEANRIKDEFLATVSHELRTPLTAILGWARMLRADKLDEHNSTRALETIERNAKLQAQLIDDLLDVSRIITGKLRIDVKMVELFPIIDAAVNSIRPAAEAKNIRLQMVLDPGANLILGDQNRLQQIIWNLLSNAIKFTPDGGRIQVQLERTNSYIEVSVTDTGKGIKPEFLPYVFDRFRQADSTSTRAQGGLGLGLAIVRHLVELHGGTVHADSPGEGKGATFTIRLPLPVEQREEPREPGRRPQSMSRTQQEWQMKLDGLRVLVVDDEPDTREMLKAMLEQCDANVQAAGSAAEALQIMEWWQPDVLVSDISMPEEDGCELIRKVRALEPDRGGKVPAVALTAYARNEDRARVLSAGFQIHVPKPVEPAELTAVIASLAGK
jgi:PAS domain S-box-containing protein